MLLLSMLFFFPIGVTFFALLAVNNELFTILLRILEELEENI
jgi:hypothetical protein